MSNRGKTFTDQRSAHERLRDLRKAAQALVDVYENIPDENPDPVRTQVWQTLRGELQGSAGVNNGKS